MNQFPIYLIFLTKHVTELCKLNCRYFSVFYNMIKLYSIENKENYPISCMQHLKESTDYLNLFRKLFGHVIPKDYNTKKLYKTQLKLRGELGREMISDIRNIMVRLRGCSYHEIFSYACENNLLFSIILSALVENIGIIYLRLLLQNPYYRGNKFFIRDFITRSALFLHFINAIYNYGLNDSRIMNVFKAFAVKNLKLLGVSRIKYNKKIF